MKQKKMMKKMTMKKRMKKKRMKKLELVQQESGLNQTLLECLEEMILFRLIFHDQDQDRGCLFSLCHRFSVDQVGLKSPAFARQRRKSVIELQWEMEWLEGFGTGV